MGSVVLAHAQANSPVTPENRITITVSNNSLSVSCKSKLVTIHSNPELDNCLQTIIPGLDHPSILLDVPSDMDREKLRTIGVTLEKFHCPVMSFRREDSIKPAASRWLDSTGH